MPFQHGKAAKAWVKTYDLTGYFDSIDVSYDGEANETTTFGNDSKTYIPGLRDGTLSLAGLWDDSARGSDAVLADLADDSSPFPVSVTVGGRVISGQAVATAVTSTSPVADVLRVSIDLQLAKHGALQKRSLIPRGWVLFDGTLASAAGEGSVVDLGAGFTDYTVGFYYAEGDAGEVDIDTSAAANFNVSTQLDTTTFTATGTAVRFEATTAVVARYARVSWSSATIDAKLRVALHRV